MEDQSNATPATEVENGSNTTQEVSSTTQPAEPTKRSLRVQTWRKIQEAKVYVASNSIFNRIPSFINSEKAAEMLSLTDEFKKAQHVKVNIDRALQEVKLQTLLANKALYLPSTWDSSALYLKVDVPADATDEQKKEALRVQDIQKFRTEINFENKIKLDLVVIGSVLVSRNGHRIGRGNGFTDLDIGLLIELGLITSDTVIATVVHGLQVVDSLPTNLFQKYDTPVDLIVTPTEVIRVTKRLPRPNGIFWELLSQRRLKILLALQKYKEMEEKAGKTIELKDEDTDVEQNQSRRRRGPIRRHFYRRNPRRTTSQTDNEQQGDNGQPKRVVRRNRPFINRRRRTFKSEGDQSGVEGKTQDGRHVEGTADRKQRRKNRPKRDFCIKLTNLTRDIRVKDLKTELRKRECNPLSIIWRGHYGKCFLHFGNRNGTPSTQDDVDRVLKSLNDLSVTVTTGSGGGGESGGAEGDAEKTPDAPVQTKTITVNVELINFVKSPGSNVENAADNSSANVVNGSGGQAGNAGGDAGAARIESVDTTTV